MSYKNFNALLERVKYQQQLQPAPIVDTNEAPTADRVTVANTDAGGRSYSVVSTGSTASIGAGKFAVYDETAGVFRLHVDSSGNVGIGLSSVPSSGLYQEKSGDSSRVRLRSYGGLGIIFGERANGVLGSPTAIVSGNQIFFFGAGGYDGTAFKSNAAGGFRVIASENWSSTAHGAYFAIETTPNGATTNSERLRVDQNGTVGIGTTTPSAQIDAVSGLAGRPSAEFQAASGETPTADNVIFRDASGTPTTSVTANGAIKLVALADADAPNGSLYYSTTASKPVWKDSGGVVTSLY
jgi:hypothetical protein